MRLHVRLACLLAVFLVCCFAAHAVRIGYNGQIGGLQLVKDFGWVYAKGRLFRTTNGHDWTDISPPDSGFVGSVFFLSPQHGWAITSRERDESGLNVFETLATENGGRTWKRFPIFMDCRDCAENGVISDLTFVDPQHGWALFMVGGNLRSGVLFATADGGRTWTKLSQPGAGKLRFLNRNYGWLVSSKMGGPPWDLFATRDGGRTWQKQTFERPSGLDERARADFEPPSFTSSKSGFLAVSFGWNAGPFEPRSQVVLYQTEDSGAHWRLQRAFPSMDGWGPPPVIEQGQVIWTYEKKDGRLVVVHDGILRPAAQFHPVANPVEAQFTDAQHGWILLQSGGCGGFKCDCYQQSTLAVTSDGGTTLAVSEPDLGPPEVIGRSCREAKLRPSKSGQR